MAALRQNRRLVIGALAVAAAAAAAGAWLWPASRGWLDAAAVALALAAALLGIARRRRPAILLAPPPPLTPELCDQLFEELPVGVVRLDPDGAISAYNRAF